MPGASNVPPENTILPTLCVVAKSWTGDTGTWVGAGVFTYAWELRLIEDDSVVESGTGTSLQGNGTYDNTNGYYLYVECTGTYGTTAARSKLDTLGVGLSGWYSASIADSPDDLSGNGNNGTYNGGMQTVADTAEGGVRAFEFDGADDYINCGVIGWDATQPWTHSAWVQYDYSETTTGQMSKVVSNNGCSSEIYRQSTYAADRVHIHGVNWTGSTQTYSDSNWKHHVWGYDGTDYFFAIDGVRVTVSGSAPTTSGVANNTYIGAENGSTRYMNGLMDDIRIYDRALSPAEISDLYTNGRGYAHRPKGLGDEKAWFSPSVDFVNYGSTTSMTNQFNDAKNISITGSETTFWVDDTSDRGLKYYIGGYGESGFMNDTASTFDCSDVFNGNTAFSISMWFNADMAQNYWYGRENATSGEVDFLVSISPSTSQVQFDLYVLNIDGSSNYTIYGYTNTNYQVGDTFHFATVFNSEMAAGSQYRMWIDGVEYPLTTSDNNAGYTATSIASGGTWTNGNVNLVTTVDMNVYWGFDDFRLYSRPLAEDEILYLALARGITGRVITNLEGEVAWWCPTLERAVTDVVSSTDVLCLTERSNNALFRANSEVVYSAGEGGTHAMSLDGTSVGTFEVTELTLTNNTRVSISAWIKPSLLNSQVKTIYAEYPTSIGDTFIGLKISAAEKIVVYGTSDTGYGGATEEDFATGGTTLSQDTWYHVTGTVDLVEGEHKVYINGVDDTATSATTTGTLASDSPNAADIGQGQSGDRFSGEIDDLRLFQRVLRPEEVAFLSTSRGITGTLSEEICDELRLTYGWSPTLQPASVATAPLDNLGTELLSDRLRPVTSGGTISLVNDTEKDGAIAIDLDAVSYYEYDYADWPTADLNIAGWFKSDSAAADEWLFNFQAGNEALNIAAQYRSDGNLRVYASAVATDFDISSVDRTQWRHIAVVASTASGNARLYVDGVLIGSTTGTYSLPTAETFYAVNYGTSNGNSAGFAGLMDTLTLGDTDLSDAEIECLANSRRSIPLQNAASAAVALFFMAE